MTEKALVDVAVGVVLRADGTVLLGQRLSGKAYYGWWEFPGGKFEAGEEAAQALARELEEEIGIHVEQSLPWVVREHVYGHAHVRLHFRRVIRWRGEPHSVEGQALAWRPSHAVDVGPLLPAAIAPIRWLGLPGEYVVSDAAGLGVESWLQRLDDWLARQPKTGQPATDPQHPSGVIGTVGMDGGHGRPSSCLPALPGLLLLREPTLAGEAFDALFEAVIGRLQGSGVRLLVSSRHPHRYARRSAEQTGGGIHLTGADLQAVARAQAGLAPWPPSSLAAEAAASPEQRWAQAQATARIPGAVPATGQGRHEPHVSGVEDGSLADACSWRAGYALVAVSCHSAEDLALAGRIGADFAVSGPVKPTRSHPEARGCGWDGFGRMLAGTPVPVFALGGMNRTDLDRALLCGAQGIAMQRAAWDR
ncbi:MAG: thiamine phosphate synthase [Lautropia sp.]|nr:thiamine phosphate synthase [Lautropia sp.]